MKEKRDKEKKLSWHEQVRQTVLEMDMPAYALMDVPRLEMTGDGQLLIERHHGVLEYSEECVRVAAHGMTLRVTGAGLQLQSMTQNEIAVTGPIFSIELQRQVG